jgi:hypothetical protein
MLEIITQLLILHFCCVKMGYSTMTSAFIKLAMLVRVSEIEVLKVVLYTKASTLEIKSVP